MNAVCAGKEYWIRKFAHAFHVGLLFGIDAAYQRPKVIAAGSPTIRILFQKGDALDALARLPAAQILRLTVLTGR